MSKENAGQFIKHLATILDLNELNFDEANSVELSIDDNIGVIIHYAEELNSLVVNLLIAPILDTDTKTTTDLLYDILCGNYMWAYTAGANLGIDRESGLLALNRIFEIAPVFANEELTMFEDAFFALAGAARYWRDYVNGVQNNDEPQSPDALLDMNNIMRV